MSNHIPKILALACAALAAPAWSAVSPQEAAAPRR